MSDRAVLGMSPNGFEPPRRQDAKRRAKTTLGVVLGFLASWRFRPFVHAALVLLLALFAPDDPPKDVIEFFGSAAESLTNAHDHGNARAFLDHFDSSMPGFVALRDQVEAMIAADEAGSTIEVVSDQGDDKKRTLDLDWLLEVDGNRPKRAVIKCTIEKRGKKWKITRLEPVSFFQK